MYLLDQPFSLWFIELGGLSLLHCGIEPDKYLILTFTTEKVNFFLSNRKVKKGISD